MSDTANTGTAAPSVESLQAELAKLRAENATLRSDLDATNKDLRSANAEARDRRHEVGELKTKLGDAVAERDRYKADAATAPNEWKSKYEASESKVRELVHGQTFEQLAKTLGVSNPTKLADLKALSGFKPGDGEKPDEEAIKASINKTLEGRSWLKDEPAAAPPSGDGKGGATTTSTAASGPTTSAAGAAQTASGGATNGTTTASRPGPGADRGASMSTTATAPSNRIPGRL